MSKQTSILLNDDALQIIKQYMQDNNYTFNKAVNEIIKKHKKDVINIKMSNEIKAINQQLETINNKLDKLL